MASGIISSSFHKILHIILIYLTVCQGQINVTDYSRMPALYKYDNFYDCINRGEVENKYLAKYCTIFVQIQPDNTSTVWQQIESMKAERYNYRHDYLYRGVCMEKCKEYLTNNETYRNFDNGLLTNEQTQMFQQFYTDKLDRTMRNYQKAIHACVNREYVQNYSLSTKTFVNFCINPQQSREKDKYFAFTVLLIICLILLNIISSLYDVKLKSQLFKPDDENNYYEVKHKDQVKRYLTAFSIYRNYKRLILPSKDDIGHDLRFLDGFRTILCLLIVFEHVFILQFFHLENTEFFEKFWSQLLPRLLVHCVIWLELFFVLSGLLLYVKFDKSQYINPKSSFLDCVNVFMRLLVSRYLRFLPSLIFVILITANLTYYHQNASVARNIIDGNCMACRNTWWLNVLMINNYFIEKPCLMHTWYMAAEFQLYAVFLMILIVIAKYPKAQVVLLAVAILAAVINFSVNYMLKLDSIFMLIPEIYRYYYFRNYETCKHLYFSSYTNINSFLLGIICGLIYMRYLRKNPENKRILGKILHYSPYIGWICIVGILYLGTTIIFHKKTTIWTAAYGLLHRHVGLAIVAVIVILRGMCNGGGFLQWSLFRVLARISFQVYLCQIVILLYVAAYINEPIHTSYIFMGAAGTLLYISTNLVAFIVALCVEYPIAELISIIDIERKAKPIN